MACCQIMRLYRDAAASSLRSSTRLLPGIFFDKPVSREGFDGWVIDCSGTASRPHQRDVLFTQPPARATKLLVPTPQGRRPLHTTRAPQQVVPVLVISFHLRPARPNLGLVSDCPNSMTLNSLFILSLIAIQVPAYYYCDVFASSKELTESP